MTIPTNARQPLFLHGGVAAEGFYLDVAADFTAPATRALTRGIYCLTSVGVNLSFSLGAGLSATAGHHLPANDSRMIVVGAAGATLNVSLAPGGTVPGAVNISQVQPNPERF